MKSFENKVAAITGAGSGIGRALALNLARQGCHLALSDVNGEGLTQTAAQARQLGVKVTQSQVNVAERDAVHAWAEQVVQEHGRVNLIFNNAGVAQGGTVEGNAYADYEWIMNINFWGVVHGSKAFLPHLKAAGEGHLVNTSSVFGLFAQPGMSAYNASKFAVRGFTESLRQELDLAGCGVSASCVHPRRDQDQHRQDRADERQPVPGHRPGRQPGAPAVQRPAAAHHRRAGGAGDPARRISG